MSIHGSILISKECDFISEKAFRKCPYLSEITKVNVLVSELSFQQVRTKAVATSGRCQTLRTSATNWPVCTNMANDIRYTCGQIG